MARALKTLLYLFSYLGVLNVLNSIIIDVDLHGDYCRTLRKTTCCPGRDDTCAVPILGTLCYCDVFCNRTSNSDCCPDFWVYCAGLPPPDPIRKKSCFRHGRLYSPGESLKNNCNFCTCEQLADGGQDFFCDSNPCLIRPTLIDAVNNLNNVWVASNYSFLWGKTLEEGINQRLGTFPPTKLTKNMTEIHTELSNVLPRDFDSRLKWAFWLRPIRNQGDCGASWAFSSSALASDRLAVMSGGIWQVELSPQNLISCQNRRQNGCKGGHLDRAWWYLRKHGTTSERCYPYVSGKTRKAEVCKRKKLRNLASDSPVVRCIDGGRDNLYFSTPPYRIAPREEYIMHEIFNNGPVQATFRVKEDFYVYQTGVYRHLNLSSGLPRSFRQQGWHSVRIIGWGETLIERVRVKYWLCANSWGTEWGEDGYFRILRGSNECDIESFVVGVWANLDFLNKNIPGIQEQPIR